MDDRWKNEVTNRFQVVHLLDLSESLVVFDILDLHWKLHHSELHNHFGLILDHTDNICNNDICEKYDT